MDDAEYLKCACKECGTHIEFPPEAAGTTVACPNCGQWTELTGSRKAPAADGVTINLGWMLLAVAVILAGIAGLWWHGHSRQTAKVPPAQISGNDAKQAARVAPVMAAATNPVPVVVTNPVAVVPAQPRAKSPDDLKAGEIGLEKTPGSSLVYAVGTLTNDSDWQRFGVRVELDLMNATGKKIGDAQDYKDILEPHQAWKFRALIPEKKVTRATMASVTEQ